MVGAADSCGTLGGFASGAASCASALGELDSLGVPEPSGDVASGAVGGVGSGSCARALGELDPVGVSEPCGTWLPAPLVESARALVLARSVDGFPLGGLSRGVRCFRWCLWSRLGLLCSRAR